MGQFTVYANKDKNTQKTYPYFVDVQNNLFSDLNSRLVIPLTPTSEVNNRVAKKLCPIIELNGSDFLFLTNQMTTVPKSILKKEFESIEPYRNQIIDAIDMLITGI